MTVDVWLPALPPSPDTRGKNVARATVPAITASNAFTTVMATNRVAMFTANQGSLLITEGNRGPNTRSSPRMPTMRYMSSVASSSATSIRSSAVMTPTSLLPSSTTGRTRKP